MNTHNLAIIFSAELSELDQASNNRRTFLLHEIIDTITSKYNTIEGVYKGTKEQSFIVTGNLKTINLIKSIAFERFNQESVLLQDTNGRAYLEFQDGSTQELGRLKEVSKKVAENSEAYTVIDNKFFLAC